MDGATYTPAVMDGRFQQRLTFSAAQQYAVTVTATDDAGNTSTVTRNVIYQPASSGDDGGDDGDSYRGDSHNYRSQDHRKDD